MDRLYVYADFDWLEKPLMVGELGCESIRGTQSYSFKYSPEWLNQNAGIILSEDIRNYTGMQYTQPGKEIFGCFSDSLPDRWGRTLMIRREQTLAKEEGRPVRNLSSFDMIMGIEDKSRMGGFRYSKTPDGDFINVTDRLGVPPIVSLRELIAASHALEEAEEKGELVDEKWIRQLHSPGTSLGGARPKANVIDEDGFMKVAKFPSRNDSGDVELWEHIAYVLARKAGISVPDTRVVKVGSQYHTLLSKRYDRTDDGRRIHYASALTMLGLQDGAGADEGYGYLDIVDFIIRGCTDVENNLRELYRRVAFNICIGNSDDHFRNHGFLLTARGWTLSPAFDMNPTLNAHQGIMISRYTNESDLDALLKASDDYFIHRDEAAAIISSVKSALKDWQKVAKILGASERDISLFSQRFITD